MQEIPTDAAFQSTFPRKGKEAADFRDFFSPDGGCREENAPAFGTFFFVYPWSKPTMENRRAFLKTSGRMLAALAGAGLAGLADRAEAAVNHYVHYWYYARNLRTGVVGLVDRMVLGPYRTRRGAQSRVDYYNSRVRIVGNYRYYYVAGVRGKTLPRPSADHFSFASSFASSR